MPTYQSQLSIPVPRVIVRAILLEPSALPEWNAGLRAITAGWRAQVGVRYPVAVRGGLTGYLLYTATGERRIETTWRIPGLAESNSWTLIPDGSGTLVRHAFENTGPVAMMLRGTFENAADVRLERLAERAVARFGARRSSHAASLLRRTSHRMGTYPTPLGRLAGAVHTLPERDLS